MLIGVLQLRESITHHGRLYLFTVFVLLTWALWAVKVVISRRYRPWTAPFTTSTSVVIPVVDEPVELFRDVLRRITEQGSDEIVVVINGRRNEVLEGVCDEFDARVRRVWTPVAGKRNAVQVGVGHCHGEVVLLVDSDTIWTENTLSELVKPFADPSVGGVTTRQRILDPRRNFLTRWADWLENSRALYAMPTQSVLGTVGCLPGRTIAFRAHILHTVMPAFMHDMFLGIFLEVSDDRTLTNLTLKQGFRTVYQSTSLVYTDAPLRLRKMVKQQFRWARGSQYNTLRMLPWMLLHAPLLAVFFAIDVLLPFLWLSSAIAWVIRQGQGTGTDFYAGLLHGSGRSHAVVAIVLLTVLTSTLAMCLRQMRHLAEVPGDVLRMPLFILFSTAVLMPIRIYGFLRLGHIGSWGTRKDAYTAGQADVVPAGDAAAALGPEVARRSAQLATTTAGAVSSSTGTSGRDDGPASRRPVVSLDGDPRGLVPYLIAVAFISLGVAYDILPV